MPPTQEASPSPDKPKSSFLNETGIKIVQTYTIPRTYNGFGEFSPYKTEAGEWLIGYGSKKIFGRTISPFISATKKEIEEQLVKDLEKLAVQVEQYVHMPLNAKKKGAVLSYAHSIGLAAFKECKLLELINTRGSKDLIIREWSPYINRKDFYPERLRERRRVELNTFVAPDAEVPLLSPHKCRLKKCLLNIGESYQGTPNQVKAIEYLEEKIKNWDKSGEVIRRFFRLWEKEQGGLGSPKNF